MVLENIKNAQKSVFEQLDQNAKIYLFHGPSGVGKLETAKFFSRKILCESSVPPCENCLSCKKFNSRTHSDFLEISIIDDKKKGRIETIRKEVLPRVYQKANEGISKVFLFDGADHMTLASFNSLLKVIEEPPPNTFFIFLTSNLYSIPITILSRCRKIRFRPLKRDVIKKILSENYEGGEEDLEKLISLNLYDEESISADRIEIAERFRKQSLLFLNEVLKSSQEVDPIKLMSLIVVKFDNTKTQRDNAISFLISIRSLLRDVLVLHISSEELLLWNIDIETDLREILFDWDEPFLIKAFLILEKAIKDLHDLNTNSTLTLESFVHSIRSFLVGR